MDAPSSGDAKPAVTSEPSAAAVLDGVFASSGVGLCLVDPDGTIRRVNDPWLASVGLRAEDVLGRHMAEVFPESPPELLGLVGRAQRGEPVDLPVHRQVVGGRERWYAGRFSPVAYPAGTGVLVTAWDVTAAKRVEQAITEEHARLRQHVASTPLALVEWDGDYRVIGYSRRAEELFGFPPEEVIGKRIDEIPWVPEEDWPSVRTVMRDMWTAARPTNVNANRNLRKDGRVIQCEWYNSALHDTSGRLVSMLSLVLDVTSRHDALEALRESEARARRAEAELRGANERLREADRRKDEFLAMLSHELRSPLAPIRNAVTILAHAAGAEQATRARAVIERQVEHMARLVDDLLDVTRVARGKIALRQEELDLSEIVRRAADDQRPLLSERGVALALELGGGPAWIRGDPTRLTQVVGNLLQNAAKFTGPGGRVTVSVAPEGGEVALRVTDTGAGIAPALLERIFEPFVQGDQAHARTQGGLGLGLALVRGIAELHGGSVRAESAGPGAGASFVVRLPAVAAVEGRPGGGGELPRARARRVLVVDDNRDAAESLGEVLRLLGHEVEVAGDGPAALEAARAHRPEVVLCDIGLPGMNGYEVARALRALLGEVRLVAVSGYARPEDVARAHEAGFDAHVAKPVDPSSLAALLGE